MIRSLLKGYRLTGPLIAAVEGPAIAGGTEILQATDIRVAGESARFGVSEPKWGLYPLGGSAVRLVRQLPYTVAADLLLTGRHIKAPEAKEIGLIGHVVPDGEALAKAHEIAALIAANGPARRAGGAQDDPRLRGQARGRVLDRTTPRSAPRCSPPTTPRRARGPSPRSAAPNFTGHLIRPRIRRANVTTAVDVDHRCTQLTRSSLHPHQRRALRGTRWW